VFTPKKILIVAAHPDDEILGCGGTVARFTRKGVKAVTLILGEGITSRGGNDDRKSLQLLKNQADKANRLIGVDEIVLGDFPDNRFDTVPLLEITQKIEQEIERVRPDTIFTHHWGDLNIDHRITHQAVLTAARPLPGSPVKMILAFEVLSSTEWGGMQRHFVPNVYFDISETLGKKVEAMEVYIGEVRSYPHPRSIKGIETLALKRGMETGVEAAEAFELTRMLI